MRIYFNKWTLWNLCNKLGFNKDPKYYADRPNEVKKLFVQVISSRKAKLQNDW